MKNIIKYITIFILGAILISCEDDDKNALPVDEFETGAVLRTININSGSIDIFTLSTGAKFEVEVEFFEDSETDVTLLESFDVFLRFRDNTAANGTNNVAEQFFTNITASSFQNGPSGLPRFTLTIPANDALDFLGLTEDQVDGGDRLEVRLALKLTTGQVFSSENRSGDVPGQFFASPFAYSAPFVCNLPTTFLVGNYQATIIQDDNPFGYSIPEAVYAITATSGTARVINGVDWIGPGGFVFNMRFDLVCGRTVVPLQNSGGGVGCGGGAITMSTPVGSEGAFDGQDDSSFTLEFRDFVADGGCGVSPPTIQIVQFDKI